MKRKRRNRRKTRKLEVHVRVPALLATILVPAFVISLVWIMAGVRCDALGTKIRALESHKDLLAKQLENEQNRWSNLTAPSSFQQILRQHGLVMSRPDEQGIVRVSGSEGTSVATAEPPHGWGYYE